MPPSTSIRRYWNETEPKLFCSPEANADFWAIGRDAGKLKTFDRRNAGSFRLGGKKAKIPARVAEGFLNTSRRGMSSASGREGAAESKGTG